MAVVDTSVPETMRSVRCHGVRDYRVESLPTVPSGGLGEREILVKTSLCGICAGDAKCYAGAPMFWGDANRSRYVETPVTPGHEFVGEVVDMGPGAAQFHGVDIGDLVTSEQVVACNTCIYCRKGLRWLCAPHHVYGFHTCVNGGLSQYMTFPGNAIVYKLPKRLAVNEAVYVEPLSCAVHGVERAGIELGDCVVVSGCGPIGLGMIGAARMRSPQRLIALDCIDERLSLARECGADIVLNPNKEDVVKRIREISGGWGCDKYLEATGNPQSVVQGLHACRKAATLLSFSVFNRETTVDWTIIGDTKELNIKGAHCSGDKGYQVAIDILDSGRLPVSKIVTHQLPLDDIVSGIEMVIDPKDSIKVSVDPHKVS